MRLFLLFLIPSLFLFSCKKEEPSLTKCDLTTNSFLHKNWTVMDYPILNPQIRNNVSLRFDPSNNYFLEFQTSFLDSAGQTIDSIVGMETGSVTMNYCHTPMQLVVFKDTGNLTFKPTGKDEYTTSFDADINHFAIAGLRLDTSSFYIGFLNEVV